MPTTKPRHALTETAEIAEALAAATQRWPEDRGHPGRLLRRLIAEGHRSIAPAAITEREQRLATLRRVAGSYTGLYEPGYLDKLRAEWPE